MSVIMGYNGGGPSAGAGGGGGVSAGGSSGEPHLIYQDTGCGLPPFQDPTGCSVGGLPVPASFQESACGLPTHHDHHHHMTPHGGHDPHGAMMGGYGSDLDSLAGSSSSSSHLPYSPEPEAPLFPEALEYGLHAMGSGNNNNNSGAVGGGIVGGGGLGGPNHGEPGGGGGGRPRRRRRTPPKAKIDINDNSLYSVYCIFKSILSASTASTVAIDNKIEQAMDLVKSHLMFAVREEVEVLKEKISELMERISQLEYENTVLRQYATQEALQQLQQPHHSSNT